MVLLRRIWPKTALAMVRFAALIFAGASIAPSLPAHPGLGVLWWLAGSAGIVLLVIVYVITFVRRRTFLGEPAVVAVLLVVIGSSREDPEAIIGLCMGALTLLSMHSTFGLAIVRLALIVGAMLTSIAISPAAQTVGLAWRAEQNAALVPILTLMALLNTAVNVLLQRQQRAAAREALLAKTGLGLVNVTDLHEVRRVVGDSLVALCAEWPEHPVLVVRRESEIAVVEVALGTTPGLVGAAVPASVVSGVPHTLTLLDKDQRSAVNALAGGAHTWRGMAFADERGGLLVLVAGRRIPPALRDGLHALGTYWSLAETSCRAHAAWVAMSSLCCSAACTAHEISGLSSRHRHVLGEGQR
jgi:hypothetical protein